MKIIDEIEWYLREGRPLFDATKIKASADLVVDGDLQTQEIVEIILAKLTDLSWINHGGKN